ncbi:helix-turn-helix domain-containing protein, partial [Aquimarina macrocephali]|uniref:helix-turn-helix domain-containing protein n=1 Tax=Aquimarina macrocephali TaxID=666563 RepID=UPI0012679DFE
MSGRCYGHLTLPERRDIFKLLVRKKSVREISDHLNRHPSTIYREIHRNRFYDEFQALNDYYPLIAQDCYRERRQKNTLLSRYPELKDFVIEK